MASVHADARLAQGRTARHRARRRRPALGRTRPGIPRRQLVNLDQPPRAQPPKNQHRHSHPVDQGGPHLRAGLGQRPRGPAWPVARKTCQPSVRPLKRTAALGENFLLRRRLNRDRGGAQVGLRIRPPHRPRPQAEVPVARRRVPRRHRWRGQRRSHRPVPQGILRDALQDGQGHVAVLLPLPVQQGQAGTRRRTRHPQVQVRMR